MLPAAIPASRPRISRETTSGAAEHDNTLPGLTWHLNRVTWSTTAGSLGAVYMSTRLAWWLPQFVIFSAVWLPYFWLATIPWNAHCHASLSTGVLLYVTITLHEEFLQRYKENVFLASPNWPCTLVVKIGPVYWTSYVPSFLPLR